MQAPFDKIAHIYDDTFTRSNIGKLQREIVYKYLNKIVIDNNHLNVLELNCGTGEDAVYLARKGCFVTASDVSREMLKQTERKIVEQNLQHQIKISRIDLNDDESFAFDQKYDLIFANFGGLNCITEERLKRLNKLFGSLLNNNGRAVFVIMPRFCLWESFYYLYKLKFKNVLRRMKNKPVAVDLGGSILQINYYSRNNIARIFSENFKIVNSIPVGCIIPPTYLNQFFSNKLWLLNLLRKFENIAIKFSFLSNVSDHYLIDMELQN